jgi:hypothetical protein
LREDWHVFGVIRDTSTSAYTPSMAYMARVVAGIVGIFMALVSFVFWLAGLGESGEVKEDLMPTPETDQQTPAAQPQPVIGPRTASD